MFCWQLTVGVDGALVTEMMDPLFVAEVAATGGNVVLNLDVMLACPISLVSKLVEGMVVGGVGIKGKKDDESDGFIPAERLFELCMEEDRMYPAAFEVGMRGKNEAWLNVLASLVCVPV